MLAEANPVGRGVISLLNAPTLGARESTRLGRNGKTTLPISKTPVSLNQEAKGF